MADCADEHREWFPQRRVCYAAMELAAAEWRYGELHDKRPYHDGTFSKWSEKRSLQYPYHYRDGVNLWIADTDLTPHDHFLGGAADCADCSGGGAVDQEQDDGGGDQAEQD